MEKSLKLFTFIVVLLCFGISSAFAQSSGSDSGITLGRFESGEGSGLENAEVEEITAEEIGDSGWSVPDTTGFERLVPVLVTDTAIPTATARPTKTPVIPTATNTSVPPTATARPTNTPVPPTATNTSVPPTATARPTNTPVPPTATNTSVPPTATATEAPTNTPVVPTATNTSVPPTATATEAPTNTPVVPTATNTSVPVVTLVSESSVPPAVEKEAVSGQTYRIHLFTDPVVIKLPRATTSYWFFVPEGTEIEDAEICLYLETSATLLEDYSTATIEVNGIAVESLNLVEFVENKGEIWEIRIPVEWLKTDGTLNEISIITAQRSILGECADIDNPANWLVISKESYLLLTILREGHTHLDNLYPLISTGFEFAGSDADAEFSAALSIASAIGGNYPYKDIDHMTVSDGDSSSDNHFVINADSSTNPALPELMAGEGYLGVSYDDGAVIDVAGGQASGLTNAVRTFSDISLLSQFSTDNAVIRHTPVHKVSSLPSREDGHYTLEDFNYTDIDLAGAFHQQTTYTVYQPDGVMGGPGSYFEVHFRHSDALLSDTSLLTVHFNGVPASSIQLSRTNTENGSLRVTIPQEVLARGTFEIGIDVYNYLGKIDCSKDWYDVAWTVIDSDSVLYYEPSDVTVIPSLNRFPSVFGEQMILSIPENSSADVKEAMLMLAARNSQNTRSIPEYYAANDVEKLEKKDANMIIAGSRRDINLPESVAKELYIAPQSDGYSVKNGVNVMPEALSDKIIVQAVRSPYDYKRIIYVIMWPDASYEQALLEFASDKKSVYQLSGELALIGPDGAVSMSAAEQAEAAIPLSPELVVNKVVRQTGIPKIGLGIILLLIVIIIFLIIRAARKKNRFESAQKKMAETNADNKDSAADEKASGSEPDDEFDDEE